jgi:CheY-like chemotaxis protein
MDQSANKRIMIVGGDTNFLYLMRRYVRRSAFEIVSVNLGEDLLARARKQSPMAIVLEVDHPETIGWQMLRTLKTDSVSCSIPVIVCSWLDDESRALTEGANSYLRMPILYTDFETALGSILLKE